MIWRPPRATLTATRCPYTTLFRSLVERLARRRQDEHADSIGHLLAHLARALPVDLQQHVAALGQPRFHRLDRRALPVAVHQRMLEEVAGIDHAREFLARNEVVVLGVALARSRLARGVGNRQADVGVARQARSEEHTSELQSLMRISYAVFCL